MLSEKNKIRPKLLSFVVMIFLLLGGAFVVTPLRASAQGTSTLQSSNSASSMSYVTGASIASQAGSSGNYPLYALAAQPGQIPENYFGYSPSEIQQVYNSTSLLNEGITGKGVTIAIVDAYGDPNITSELAAFDSAFNLPPPPSFNVACIDGPCNYTMGITTGWNTEIALDVEWSHAMAPGANINLYIASNSNSTPLFDAELAAVEGATGTAPWGTGLGRLGVYNNNIISNSWGSPENSLTDSQSFNINLSLLGYPWLDQVFQEAAAKGITVFASSGDDGAFAQDYDYGIQTLLYGGIGSPADDPFVTSVGGTTLYMSTTGGSLGFPPADAKGTYGNETAWSWINLQALAPGYQAGTTGGFSTIFGQPLYQSGPGVPENGVRANPDVSWDGDPYTGVIIYTTSNGAITPIDIGGTSVGSPSWAGAMALIDQAAGRSLGFMNPTFYSILNNPSEYFKAFHDVTFGNNNPYSAGPGWDPTTGIGSPNIGELADIIASMKTPVTVSVTDNLAQPVQPLSPTPAYNYGDTVTLSASVNEQGWKSSAYVLQVLANITSPSGALIATNIPLTWNGATHTYVGTYTIKPTDPSGEWLVDVKATAGYNSGIGYDQFQVGDSINILSPLPYANTLVFGSNFYEIGNTVFLAVNVENAANTHSITRGSYSATFYLNQVNGKVEGSVPLRYNATAGLWEGRFTIPNSADQGAWAVVFSGVDPNGNLAAIAYSWINVGLVIFPYTDTSTYVLGETMTIYANTTVNAGTFTGTVSYDGTTLGTVPLSIYNATTDIWSGTFNIPQNGPTGFYTVTVSGGDTSGNYGSLSEVVRVAPYNLTVGLTLSKDVLHINGDEEYISATVINGNGLPVTVGTVQAYVYLQLPNGTIINPFAGQQGYQDGLPLTYNRVTHSFVGEFTTSGTPNWIHGKYVVDIEAFDSIGDYGYTLANLTVVGPSYWYSFKIR